MNKFTLVLGFLLLIAVVNARHYGDRRDSGSSGDDDEQSDFKKERDYPTLNRHRRRRWQLNYGYDYQPPRHYTERRDYYQNQQDLIPQIFRLLDELAVEVRRQPPPPPPPQPIYIPYPVPYYVPQYVPCNVNQTKKPDIKQRFPDMEDTNQNWGFATSNESDYDDGLDGKRPISFDKIRPKGVIKRPAPPVEHGSSQNEASTKAPKINDQAAITMPSMCQAAALSCCGFSDDKSQQKQCFTNVGCAMTYANGKACTLDAITEALNVFQNAYAPVN
ncbi:uncharacterized protein LOC114240836 [Bombyx mandarina]|uniref:Uncharacterized protein LOC114240836 n=1 Tax=Bombyx mandarina TaxID=7092 RepID=A0A6J2JE45_BOMMA|nr:uncharacterized protein LOC114240836 [Bombyx mandarina]XP_028027322.1 uncharacterized protein LOC114240836 [Bombyx mandarina]